VWSDLIHCYTDVQFPALQTRSILINVLTPSNCFRTLFRVITGCNIIFGFLLGNRVLSAQSIHFSRTLPSLAEAIAFNPLSRGLIVYAGLKDSEGIYKSYDGGYHWSHLFGGPNPLEAGSSDDIGQIYIMPSDTSVLLVGSTNARYGLSRSVDGGSNWKRVIENVSSEGQTIFEIPDKFHTGHDTIYFGESSTGHLWRTTDKGVTWDSLKAAIAQPPICTIVRDPTSTTTFLAGAADGAISRTTDGGMTWDTTHPADVSGLADVPRIQFDPKTPSRVWATVYYYTNESLLRSEDGGKTWKAQKSPTDEWAFDLDPADPQRMWMGRFSGFHPGKEHFDQSTDGGITWTDEGLDSVTDIWVIKYDPSAGRLAIATSSGVYIAEVGTRGVETLPVPSASLFPNPARSSLTVTFDATAPKIVGDLKIVDLLGRTMWSASHAPTNSIDVSHWLNGVYSLLESKASSIPSIRFVVNH
jgi:hypothetical protein